MALTNLEFYAIQPKEATNLITNPSFELGTTGYSALGAGVSIAQTAAQQRRGVYGLEITPAANVISGASFSVAVTNGVQYSISLDIKDVVGQTFYIQADDSVTQFTGTSWVGNGQWKRRYLTFTAAHTATGTFYILRASTNSTTKFYTDGWQLETGVVSSYLDGDMKGFVRGETAYYWNGTPHASTSFRSGQTRSGGTEVRLRDYLRILAVFGLGLAPVINNSLPNVRGGSFFQNSVYDSRTISLSTGINGATVGDFLKNRAAIEAALNVRQTQADQPMILRIKGYDSAGIEQAETVDAIVQYSGGLDGAWESLIEKAPLQFTQFMPYLQNEAEVGQALTINQTVTNTDYVAYRDNTGLWKSLGAGTNADVYKFVVGLDGTIYICGTFTLAGGVANTAYVAKWAVGASAWTSLTTGLSGGVGMTMALAPDGSLYVGGSFTAAGGVANTARIAKWNGSAWSALSTGIASPVRAMAFGPDGSLYVGGDFTNLGDANGDYIVKWNGSAWSSLGTGMNGAVRALEVGPDGSLYAGGDFTSAGGVSNTARIAKWNGTAWSALGTGAADNSVLAIEIAPDGMLYAGGSFTAMGGVTNTSRIAKWNGSSWIALGTGIGDFEVDCISALPNNTILMGGAFTLAGGLSVTNLVLWNGSAWTNSDIIPPGVGPIIHTVLADRNNLYIGYDKSGSSTAPSVLSVTNSAGYAVAPKVILTGPGKIYQIKNVTSGKVIYFNLTLNAGETAVLDLDPTNPKFTSSFRGNIINTILPGSNLDWTLFPGANSISCFIAGTTSAATTCSIVWRPLYSTYDAAVY